MYQPVPGAERLAVPEDVQEMFDWAASQGVKWPKIVYPVLFPPGYVGSMAIDEILPNERIVTAPNKSLFTTQAALSGDLKEVFAQCPESFTKSMLTLVTFLIWEKSKGSASPWAAFIKYQPKNAANLQDWSPEELAELQDPDLRIDASQRKKYHQYGWEHWKSTLAKFPQFTAEMLSLEEYTWAFRVIGTRSFGKFMPYITLFPVGELLNHDNVQTYYIYQFNHEKPDASSRYSGIVDQKDHDEDLLSTETIILMTCDLVLSLNEELNKTSKDLEKLATLRHQCKIIDDKEKKETEEHKKYRPPDMDLTENDEKEASICAGPDEHYLPGSEVYMSYGRYSNKQLLSTYGFALKENYYNYARVKVMLKDLANGPEQAQFLESIQAFCVFKFKNCRLGTDFLRVLRGLNWQHWQPTNAFLEPTMADSEVSVLTIALRVLTNYLEKFGTSYQEDLVIMQEQMPLRKYFAILFRSQVKQLIIQQIKYLQVAKCIMERLNIGVSFENSIRLVEAEETESGNEYLDMESNRKALQEYLQAYNSLN